MKYSPYSASSLAVFQQCPRKFKYAKIDKIPVEFQKTEALLRGSGVHYLLEHNEKPLKEKVNGLWKTEEEITKELIKQSVSIYKDFQNCEYYDFFFNKCKTLARELPVALKIENGKLVPCEFLDKNAIYRGYIDAVFVDEETDMVYIVDWKTGKDKSEGTYKQSPDQLIYYAAWYFNKFPVDKVTLMYVFVEHCTKLDYVLERENLDRYTKMLLTNILKVEKETEFPKVDSALCQYCDFLEICQKD